VARVVHTGSARLDRCPDVRSSTQLSDHRRRRRTPSATVYRHASVRVVERRRTRRRDRA
jgi:hypothetical protein